MDKMRSLVRFLPLAVYIYHIHINLKFEELLLFGDDYFAYEVNPFLARLHFSAEELLLYPRRRRRCPRRRPRPHAKC